jgi:CRP-like cAMP-binding protein
VYRTGEEIWLEPGEEFITEGQPAENFYVLLKGQVRITKKVSEKKETAVAHHDEMVEVVEVVSILKGESELVIVDLTYP